MGELVATRFAGASPIRAIDSFTLGRDTGAGLARRAPFGCDRGALGGTCPRRICALTASHALFIDGFLVPAGDLVNGTSIILETADGQDTLDFFYLTLDRHDVIDAQGAPCELRRDPAVESCAPQLGFNGGRSEVRSRLRSALSLVVDRRQPIDLIRDELEDRALQLAQAA